jgi:hypothetical protein
MMNLDDIATRIAQPDSTQAQDITAFQELTVKYPYAQVFSILYLKALSSKNDVFFEDALQKHAYRVTDRMKLYDLIQGAQHVETEILPEVESPAAEIPAAEPEILAVETAESEIIPEVIAAETAPEAIPEQTTAEITPEAASEAETIPAEAETPETIAAEVLPEPETETVSPEPSAETVPETTPELPVEIIPEEVTPASTPEPINTTAKADPVDIHHLPEPQDMVELDILAHAVGHVYPDQLDKTTATPEKTAETPEILPEKPVAAPEPEIHAAETPVQPAADRPVTTPRSFTSWIRADNHGTEKAPEKSDPEPEAPKKQIDEIINNFIQEEPSITRPKKEFYSPTKKAKESVDPGGLIYTETLANIFAIQGNYPKAILAYEQLILTNPEKKIFFALRIHELKEKLNT